MQTCRGLHGSLRNFKILVLRNRCHPLIRLFNDIKCEQCPYEISSFELENKDFFRFFAKLKNEKSIFHICFFAFFDLFRVI